MIPKQFTHHSLKNPRPIKKYYTTENLHQYVDPGRPISGANLKPILGGKKLAPIVEIGDTRNGEFNLGDELRSARNTFVPIIKLKKQI